ncbi:MAG: ABC transporter ATP-binding protein, partial [Burkholderiaceae bacterium]|nr:ABC transporter ATP-binding protein [Burkholderiaceae bacterium]
RHENSLEEFLTISHYSVLFPTRSSSWFQKEKLTVVNDVSLSVKKGKTLALVGESGSGKTTLIKGILQLLRGKAKTQGEVKLLGVDLEKLNVKQLRTMRKNIQVVFQDPFSSLNPRLQIKEILQEGLLSLRPDLSYDEIGKRIESVLFQCGLNSNMLNRYPHEFSGGQRQRLAIARALVVEPKVLICDEPTSALDVSVQAQILNLITEIQRSKEISILFITHNFSVVRYLADEIAVMKNGEIVEYGSAEKVLLNPQEIYTKQLLEAVPSFTRSQF